MDGVVNRLVDQLEGEIARRLAFPKCPTMKVSARTVRITDYDHVGIRVSDRARAMSFYERLGFYVDPDFTDDRVAEMVTANEVRINLIFNAAAPPSAHNTQLDDPMKLPGCTRAAFVVEDLDTILEWAKREGVPIIEGPVDWGRRLTCSLCDPDGNVLEFNQMIDRDRMR